MSKKLAFAVAFLAAGLVACGDDDPTDPGDDTDPIVGVWFSGGADVAPGLRIEPFNVDSIHATFRENMTYEVIQYTPDVTFTLTGTYTVGEGGENVIRPVTVQQTSPVAVVAQGIFRVAGNRMEYEVIQTEPALAGVNPPTVAGGFGSTSIGGQATPFYIQGYVRR